MQHDDEAVWSLWKRLQQVISLRGLARELLTSRQAVEWRADYVTSLRTATLTRRTCDLVQPLTDADLRRLHQLALLNARRVGAAARWMAIAYVSAPLSAVVTVNELDPSFSTRLRGELDGGILTGLALIGVCVLYQIVRAWQAQQMVNRLELAMFARGLPIDAGGPASPGGSG